MISQTQREILNALITIYERKKEAVKGEDISGELKRNPGTIRNQMQTLKALGYVEGVPGPKGGYTPSTKAYQALNLEQINKPYQVHVIREGKPIEGLSVQKIEFNKVSHPTDCTSVITVSGDTRKIKDHDIIKVGPTPVNHLVLQGEVIGRDDTRKEILVISHSITSIPKGKAIDVASKNLISFNPEMKIKEAARILTEKRISAAPVIEYNQLIGILTEGEIVRAVSKDKTEGTVREVMQREVITIDKDARIIDCVEKMYEYDVGRLIVMDGDKPIGMLTKTDIIQRMLD